MKAFRNILLDFISALENASSIEECFDSFEKAVENLGFAGVVYTSIPVRLTPLLTDSGPIFLRSQGYNPDYLEHYQYEGFSSKDFTIKRILNSDLRVMDWWREERNGALSRSEIEVIQVAREDYGMTNGVSIPTLSANDQIAGASIISDEDDFSFQTLLEERLEALQSITHLFHNRIYSDKEFHGKFYAPLIDRLTTKEILVLRYIAKGLPMKSIDQYYDIRPSYANNVRSKIYRKLNVKNINQLNYVLGIYRILDII